MFKTILNSFSKSKKLRELSLRMATPDDWMDQVAQGTHDFDDEDRAKDELFSLCENDPHLSQVLIKHNANRQLLDELHTRLIQAGAGQWARKHWVPASAFAFGSTLEYLLNHKDDSDFDIFAYTLIMYFQNNKSGAVE